MEFAHTSRRNTEDLGKHIFGDKNEKDIVFSQDLKKALIKRIRFGNKPVKSMVFCGGDDHVITSSLTENSVKFWQLWDRTLLREFSNLDGPVSETRATSDAKQLCGAGMSSCLFLWDTESGKTIWKRETDYSLLCCDLSSDNNLIVTGSDMNHTMLLWDRRSGDVVQALSKQLTGSVTKTVFSPANSHIAVATNEGPAKLYDLRSNTISLTFNNDYVLISGLAFEKDGRRLLVSAMNSRVYLYDIAVGDYRINPNETLLDIVRPACVTCCDFSTYESRLCACGSSDGRVTIWNIDKTEVLFDLLSHNEPVMDCVFSPSGNYLLTGCCDGTGRLWSIPELKDTKRYRWLLEKDPIVRKCGGCGGTFPICDSKVTSVTEFCSFCRLSGMKRKANQSSKPCQ